MKIYYIIIIVNVIAQYATVYISYKYMKRMKSPLRSEFSIDDSLSYISYVDSYLFLPLLHYDSRCYDIMIADVNWCCNETA